MRGTEGTGGAQGPDVPVYPGWVPGVQCRIRGTECTGGAQGPGVRLEPNDKGVTGWLGHVAQNGCEMALRRLAHGCEMALRRLAHHPVFGVCTASDSLVEVSNCLKRPFVTSPSPLPFQRSSSNSAPISIYVHSPVPALVSVSIPNSIFTRILIEVFSGYQPHYVSNARPGLFTHQRTHRLSATHLPH